MIYIKKRRLEIFKKLFNSFLKRYLHKIAKKKMLEDNEKKLIINSFDAIGNSINIDGGYEQDFLETLKKYLLTNYKEVENKIAIDVGAYIGTHSIFFSKIFKKVISFEPHPRSFEILKLNSNNYENIEIFNLGCSNKNYKAKLRGKHTNVGGSTITNEKSIFNHEIKLVKLDDHLLEINGEIGLIKIDTEGHENEVIQGSRKIINKYRPIIVFESNDISKRDNQIPLCVETLKSLGYNKFFEFDFINNKNFFKNNIISSCLNLFLNFILGNNFGIKEIKSFENKKYQNLIALPNSFKI